MGGSISTTEVMSYDVFLRKHQGVAFWSPSDCTCVKISGVIFSDN